MVKFIGVIPDPKPTRVQCDEPFDFSQYQSSYRGRRIEDMTKQGKNPLCCAHFATYEIEGRNLCTRHAGPIALKILAKRDQLDD